MQITVPVCCHVCSQPVELKTNDARFSGTRQYLVIPAPQQRNACWHQIEQESGYKSKTLMDKKNKFIQLRVLLPGFKVKRSYFFFFSSLSWKLVDYRYLGIYKKVRWLFSEHRRSLCCTWFRFREMCVCVCVCVLVTQSCLTLCDPMDCSPPAFSVHGILQARILE